MNHGEIVVLKWMRMVMIGLSSGLCIVPTAAYADNSLELGIGIHLIQSEVANTDRARNVGLMHRRHLERNHGMLFVFGREGQHCMWMRNTLLPLSVAFLDGQGRILNIEDMSPQTDDSHCAAKPAHFALEMNAGWFRQRGVVAGMSVRGLDRAPRGL